MNNSESTKLFSGFYHSRDLCATDSEGVCLICRQRGRLSLQVREEFGKFLGIELVRVSCFSFEMLLVIS